MAARTYAVELQAVRKSFGSVRVLNDLNLSVQQGEIVALLGPSGCGKSTALNIIAGFLVPDQGLVLLDGEIANKIPTHRRNLGMVFQGFSLFPHMNVFSNVAFGLSVRRRSAQETRDRVREALSLVQLQDFGERFPAQLSGGQQQRVALARALVVEPKVLLLDEPLSNLDAGLRKEMQVELKRIHESTGVTMIHVTHDQEEAVVLADRIALIRNGGIEQLDHAREIFERPKTKFVAQFMGFGNVLPGDVKGRRGDEILVNVGRGDVIAVKDNNYAVERGQSVLIAVREERLHLEPTSAVCDAGWLSEEHEHQNGLNRLVARIDNIVYTGMNYEVFATTQDDLGIRVRLPIQSYLKLKPIIGQVVRVLLPSDQLHIVLYE